eukprot:5852476-Ditylum_brightwellii.AAC.1
MTYNHNMIMQHKVDVDWVWIKKTRCANMIKNNIRENTKRLPCEYKIGEYVFIVKSAQEPRLQKKIGEPTEGPFTTLRVFYNGTVQIQKDRYTKR